MQLKSTCGPRVPCFLALPFSMQNIMLQIGLTACLIVCLCRILGETAFWIYERSGEKVVADTLRHAERKIIGGH